MEDFTRECNQGSALFFLYGNNGVGKTRLLRELSQSRLADHAIYWLDLDSSKNNDDSPMDRGAEIEALFAAAGNGDIIIADHFESALKKSRHQLFLSWSTDGVDKQLNLVIASNAEGFDELRQLSQHYQVQAKSFEQMPFNDEEVQAFLGFYLFPDQPTARLTIPSALRKQVSATQGLVGQLIEFADREGSQISSIVRASTGKTRGGGRMTYAFILLVVLAAGVGWYLHKQDRLVEIPLFATADPTVDKRSQNLAETTIAVETPEQAEPSPTTGTAIAIESNETPMTVPELAEVGETTDTTEAEIEPLSVAESTDLDEPLDIASVEGGVPAEFPTQTSQLSETGADEPAGSLQQSEPGTISDSEAVIEESFVEVQSSVSVKKEETVVAETPESGQARFQLDLQQSMDWIMQRNDKVGTIQIMLLSYARFDVDNYYEYVAELARRGAEIDKLRVFKTYTGNREVYSVVYDEFVSRKAAIGAIDGLPTVLRDASPLARSVGGLWQEIRRLDTGN